MFTQIKRNKNQKFFKFNFLKNLKGVSPIIGYVLLVTFVIVLGVIIYNWMKTYVPSEGLECPDGTSLFIKSYSCENNSLEIILKNNGKFNIGGYYIYATTSAEQELATKDISFYIDEESAKLTPTGIKFTGEENSLKPNAEETEVFDLSTGNFTIYSIEIIPLRWQKENRISRIVTCSEGEVREVISCS